MRLGRHMSKSVEHMRIAHAMGCDAVQIFVTNPRGWQVPVPNAREDAAICDALDTLGLRPLIVHAAYIINLASPNDEIFEKSVTLLRATLQRAAALGATDVVFHIGSHSGSGEDAGLTRLTEGIKRVLDGTPENVRLLLENDTGGGGKLGYRFANLRAVLDRLPPEDARRVGICLDTAHLWGAGYDVATPEGAERTLTEADAELGLRHVHVFHLNDAREGLGSHRDIHARFGEGQIGPEGIGAVMRDARLAHVTGILETPYPELRPGVQDWDAEREHMQRARALTSPPTPLP